MSKYIALPFTIIFIALSACSDVTSVNSTVAAPEDSTASGVIAVTRSGENRVLVFFNSQIVSLEDSAELPTGICANDGKRVASSEIVNPQHPENLPMGTKIHVINCV